MKKIVAVSSFIFLTIYASAQTHKWEHYDMVIAVVNETAIVESEVLNKLNQNAKINNGVINDITKSRMIDQLIENAFVTEVANNQSIIVTNKKVLDYVQRLMRDFFSKKIADKKELEDTIRDISNRIEKKIDDEPVSKNPKLDTLTSEFIQFIEEQKKISFGDYFEDIRISMKREMVMSIAIGVTPPSKEETKRWFINNSDKLGDDFHIKHILIRPLDNSLAEQKNTNRKLAELRARIMAGESFEKIAAQYSQDPISAQKGGDLGWVTLQELDPYFATYANQLYRKGEISNVVSSSFGYHLIKLVDRKPTTYEKVEKLIMFKLYNESMIEQFNKWVNKRRNESDIRIYMPKYVKG